MGFKFTLLSASFAIDWGGHSFSSPRAPKQETTMDDAKKVDGRCCNYQLFDM